MKLVGENRQKNGLTNNHQSGSVQEKKKVIQTGFEGMGK